MVGIKNIRGRELRVYLEFNCSLGDLKVGQCRQKFELKCRYYENYGYEAIVAVSRLLVVKTDITEFFYILRANKWS